MPNVSPKMLRTLIARDKMLREKLAEEEKQAVETEKRTVEAARLRLRVAETVRKYSFHWSTVVGLGGLFLSTMIPGVARTIPYSDLAMAIVLMLKTTAGLSMGAGALGFMGNILKDTLGVLTEDDRKLLAATTSQVKDGGEVVEPTEEVEGLPDDLDDALEADFELDDDPAFDILDQEH